MPRTNTTATQSDPIWVAYQMFKGGCENIPQSREMLNVVETARTTGVKHPDNPRQTIRNAVHVYLKTGYTETPEIVQTVVDKYNRVEVDRRRRHGSTDIEKLSFVTPTDL